LRLQTRPRIRIEPGTPRERHLRIYRIHSSIPGHPQGRRIHRDGASTRTGAHLQGQANCLLSTDCRSHHVSEREFSDIIAEAPVDAKRTLRVVSRHTRRRDHPVILTFPETAYLNGWTFQWVGGY
jgi:hypothetical protein